MTKQQARIYALERLSRAAKGMTLIKTELDEDLDLQLVREELDHIAEWLGGKANHPAKEELEPLGQALVKELQNLNANLEPLREYLSHRIKEEVVK